MRKLGRYPSQKSLRYGPSIDQDQVRPLAGWLDGAITLSRTPDAAPRSLAPASRRHHEPSQCRALRALAIARGGAARLYLFYHRQHIGAKPPAFALLEAMPRRCSCLSFGPPSFTRILRGAQGRGRQAEDATRRLVASAPGASSARPLCAQRQALLFQIAEEGRQLDRAGRCLCLVPDRALGAGCAKPDASLLRRRQCCFGSS